VAPTEDDDLPRPLRRSPAKAKRLFREVRADALERYGDESRAYRTAYAALKHSYERVEGRWTEKAEKGPSDPQAALGGRAARDGRRETFGGVDVNGNTKAELYERARRLEVPGRSRMTKHELAAAIARRQD
jgi:cation transport regulator ChaB